MASAEKPLQIPPENSEWCPKCGASLNKREEIHQIAAPGTVVCDACGAPRIEPQVDASNFGNAPPPVPGRGRNPLALLVVAVVAAGMLYIGFHMARRDGPDAPAILGKSTPAPDFTLDKLDGGKLKLSDLRGKAVLLNFWATWCGPCKIETPWLVEMQNEYGSQGLQVVGVAMDDSGKDEIEQFAKEMGMNYPILLGKEAVGDEYGGVPALPESFFIGRDGKIVDRIIGLRGRAEIEDSIKKALDTQARAGNAPSELSPLRAHN
ncbi:MAG: TlpA disulfide reductase family protein [Candidatus Sulfotelmatobacter sp.]